MKSESFAKGLKFDTRGSEPKFSNADQDGFDPDVYAWGQLALSGKAVTGFHVTVYNHTDEMIGAGYMFREFTVVATNGRRYVFGESFALFRQNAIDPGRSAGFNISFGDILLKREDIREIICSFDMGNIKIVLLPVPPMAGLAKTPAAKPETKPEAKPEKRETVDQEAEAPKEIKEKETKKEEPANKQAWSGRNFWSRGKRKVEGHEQKAPANEQKVQVTEEAAEAKEEAPKKREEAPKQGIVSVPPKTNVAPGNSSRQMSPFAWILPAKPKQEKPEVQSSKLKTGKKEETVKKTQWPKRNFWWRHQPKNESKKQKEAAPPEPVKVTQPRTTGRVVMVDQANGFLVVNVGAADGLREGQELGILRKGRFIGKVLVKKLRPGSSAGVILSEETQEPVKINDNVTIL